MRISSIRTSVWSGASSRPPTPQKLMALSLLAMVRAVYNEENSATLEATLATIHHSMTHPTLQRSNDASANAHGLVSCSGSPGSFSSLEGPQLEEISIRFLSVCSNRPRWRQSVSITNEYGQNLAHMAVALGYTRLFWHLIRWGIDLHAADVTGTTPLHLAHLFHHTECAIILIRSGVSKFILDDLGRSPCALRISAPDSRVAAPQYPSWGGSIPAVDEVQQEACGTDEKWFLVERWVREQAHSPQDDNLPQSKLSGEPIAFTLPKPLCVGLHCVSDGLTFVQWLLAQPIPPIPPSHELADVEERDQIVLHSSLANRNGPALVVVYHRTTGISRTLFNLGSGPRPIRETAPNHKPPRCGHPRTHVSTSSPPLSTGMLALDNGRGEGPSRLLCKTISITQDLVLPKASGGNSLKSPITVPSELLLEVAILLHNDHISSCEVGAPHPLMSFGL
jgi:hypothetical protein